MNMWNPNWWNCGPVNRPLPPLWPCPPSRPPENAGCGCDLTILGTDCCGNLILCLKRKRLCEVNGCSHALPPVLLDILFRPMSRAGRGNFPARDF